MDPLSALISLMRPRTIVSKIVSGAGRWGVRYPSVGSAGFGVVLTGSCHFHVQGCGPVRLVAGDFVLLPSAPSFVMASDPEFDPESIEPNISPGSSVGVHHGDAGSMPDFELLGGYFHFNPANAPLLTQILPTMIHVRRAETTAQRLANTIGFLTEEARTSRPGRDLVLERLIEVLLIEALRYRPEQTGMHIRPGLLAGLADDRIGRALASFHADIAQAWSVASLADEARLSRTTFSERFTRLVGVPPMTYLLQWRMAVAKDILQSERLQQDAVAAMIGYGSASAFSTAFRREIGQAPGEYARTVMALA